MQESPGVATHPLIAQHFAEIYVAAKFYRLVKVVCLPKFLFRESSSEIKALSPSGTHTFLLLRKSLFIIVHLL